MRKTIRFVMVILAVGMMALSVYKLVGIYAEYSSASKLYDDYAGRFVKVDVREESKTGQGSNTAQESETNQSSEAGQEMHLSEADKLSVDFDSLLSENSDVVCWIFSEDTPINYPVVQSSDNSYYLRRLMDGSYNAAGTIFMDYRNTPDFTDLNTILYGHNMKNDSMFGTLGNYKSQEYYDKHPVMYLITPQLICKVELIAGCVTDASSDIFSIPQTKEEQKTLIEEITEKSTFTPNTSFQEGDRLITLSTCTYEYDTARFILVGKITRI